MPQPLVHALFALGIYLGNPNASDPNAEAAFEASYASFTNAMGVSPAYIDCYVDNAQPVESWPGNAAWQAWSNAQSPDAKGLTPVIGLMMNTTSRPSPAFSQQFLAFAHGLHDGPIRGVVDAWAQQGFSKLIIRLGLEMNIDGPGYAGDDAQSQANWVAAFQHVYRVLHEQARADHIAIEVMWNPDTTNYSNAHATTSLYPGDAFVDIIGADMYADMWPYSDSAPTPSYHDWDTGQEDPTIPIFMADPINREHYWSYPAATEWSLDSSGGHSQSLDSLVQFAIAHNKPFAIPEAGAGNSQYGNDVTDDAAFPVWLAGELTNAQSAGLKIAFVTIWDSNGGGYYEYSFPSDNKPQELAAWQKYFGALPASTTWLAPAIALGSGGDQLMLAIAEDAWQGDAQFTVAVDGTQIGGTQTAAASYEAGQQQQFLVKGNWGSGPHTVTVTYLNDANDGTVAEDRNLYVTWARYNGTAGTPDQLFMFDGGAQSVIVGK